MGTEFGRGSASPATKTVKRLRQSDRPHQYTVVLINDDYTPMDFVVIVLRQFFAMSYPTAVRVMLDVHRLGKGVCGIYTRDIAETKIAQVTEYARLNEYPLLCKMEKV